MFASDEEKMKKAQKDFGRGTADRMRGLMPPQPRGAAKENFVQLFAKIARFTY